GIVQNTFLNSFHGINSIADAFSRSECSGNGGAHVAVVVVQLWRTAVFFRGYQIIHLYQFAFIVFYEHRSEVRWFIAVFFVELPHNLVLLSVHQKITKSLSA